MINKKLLKYLDGSEAEYKIVEHRMVYTAYDVAATMKVKLNQIAKSLLVKFNKPFEDGTKPYALAIVGADKNIDLKKLGKIISEWAVRLNRESRLKKSDKNKKPAVDGYNKINKVDIPKEKVMKDKFKVKPGTMAAFGRVYKLPVFVDKALKGTVVFSSGSFNESIKMKVGDFVKLEQAMTGNFSAAKKIRKSKVKTKNKQ